MPKTLFPNYADEPRFTEQLSPLYALVNHVRRDRATLHETWMRYYKIWSAERDQQAYRGRSRTYLAVGRRVIENWVHKVKADLFPADFWDVLALRDSFESRRPAIKSLFDYYFSKHMQIRRKATPYLRQLVTYGTSPVGVTWREDSRTLPVLQELLDPHGNPTRQTQLSEQTVLQYIGPTFRLIDLFTWYIWPTTVMDVADADLIFEDQLVDRSRLLALGASLINPDLPALGTQLANVDRLLDVLGAGAKPGEEKRDYERRRLAAKGFSSRFDAPEDSRPVDITTCWWKANLDGAGLKWWRIILGCDTTPLKIQENPYWHGLPPYLCGKFTEVENEFYGRGLPETFDRMQYFLNDVADQANDGLVFSMNPIAVVDTYKVQVPDSIRMRPGAKWLAEVEGIKFAEPPKETPAIGFTAVSQIVGMINDVANVATFTGLPTGGRSSRGRGAQTATGAQILASENLVQIRDVVENQEYQVFVPLLRMMHGLSTQCLADPILLRIVGRDAAGMIDRKITAADIVGDYDFAWLGSISAHNQQVRAAQMINFLQMATQIPPQLLAQQNRAIDYGELLTTIWTDSLGQRNADRIIKELVPMRAVDYRIENDLFRVGRGEEVTVNPADPHQQHIEGHDLVILDPATPELIRQQVIKHNQQHLQALVQADLQQKLQGVMQFAQIAQTLTGGGPQGQPGGGPPNGRGGPSAPLGTPRNPGRSPQTATQDDVMRQVSRAEGNANG